jgi:8-oxo-dGTP pyrophosphatase MutT (NUDIX family)
MKIREASAGGVVFHEGRVLVLRRGTGEWVMPKGKVEAGELDAEAALREVKEESGLSATIVEPLGMTHYRYPAASNDPIHKTVRWFLMKCRESDLEIEPVFGEGRFVQPEEALQLLTFAGDQEVLRKALAQIHRKQEILGRRAGQVLNSISVPGVGPMTWREKLLILSILVLAAAYVIGMMVLAGNRP